MKKLTLIFASLSTLACATQPNDSLLSKLEAWKNKQILRDTGSCEGCNLRNQQLTKVLEALSKESSNEQINLKGADLSCANIENTKIYNCNLEEANLTEVNASGADFNNVILAKAIIEHMKADYANFENVDFTQTNLCNFSPKSANYENCNLTNVCYSQCATFIMSQVNNCYVQYGPLFGIYFRFSCRKTNNKSA